MTSEAHTETLTRTGLKRTNYDELSELLFQILTRTLSIKKTVSSCLAKSNLLAFATLQMFIGNASSDRNYRIDT